GLADEAVVELGAVHVVVFDGELGIERREVLEQRRGRDRVGGRIDDDLSLLLRVGDDRGRGGREGSGRRGRPEKGENQDQSANGWHGKPRGWDVFVLSRRSSRPGTRNGCGGPARTHSDLPRR